MARTSASIETHSVHDAHPHWSFSGAVKLPRRSRSCLSGRLAHACPRRRRRAAQAFSLVELTVVILMMGILSAVSVPRFADAYRQHCVSAAASRIAADLVRAQSAAFGASTSTSVTFDVAASSYRVANVRPLDRSSGTYTVDLKLHPYQAKLVTVWNQTGLQSLSFNGYGLPDKGGSIVVECGGARKTVLVNATTGTAVVQ